jgi:glycine/D-amino acid oxidase-like deaminating enzyme
VRENTERGDIRLPKAASVVVVGAGVHGLSAAYHLAELFEAKGGSGGEVVVLEKGRVGAGASGISGGIVRNFYLSPVINEIVRQSVEIFEIDPALFGFRQVGYLAVVPEAQATELEQIAGQQVSIGYASTLTRGADAVSAYMRTLFPDWQAQGATAVLHELRSGWADAQQTLAALAGMARTCGVTILEGVKVVGFDFVGGAISSIDTSEGAIACDAVVLAPGPWARDLWRMLGLPASFEIGCGDEARSEPAFHYWQVREGEYIHSARRLEARAPVVHLDVDVPLVSADDGSRLLEAPWGIYFRPGLGNGVACGGLPLPLDADCVLDPYGPSHEEHGTTDPSFDEATTAALTWALGRFSDPKGTWQSSSFAAPTCFTPDSYPIVGFVRENAYALLDSNHGFKMLALGKLAAIEILGGSSPDLSPFHPERFAEAALHPTSTSPYPWT